MKIAIILPGHARAWDFCKENFLQTLYDKNHIIDVFVETYNEIFRTDYHLHNEFEMNVTKTDEEIKQMFEGINVVSFSIEPEVKGISEQMQKRKILRVFDSFLKHEEKYGKYDLVVRSRFDLLLDEKLDYEKILERCSENPKMIYIGNGALHMPENDMFAVCNSDTFKIYINRLNTYPYQGEAMLHHHSMKYIAQTMGIVYNQVIGISIVRLDGKRNYRIEK